MGEVTLGSDTGDLGVLLRFWHALQQFGQLLPYRLFHKEIFGVLGQKGQIAAEQILSLPLFQRYAVQQQLDRAVADLYSLTAADLDAVRAMLEAI